MKVLKNKALLDLAERAAATFAQAFLAVEIVDQKSITQPESLKIAAGAGLLAVGKWLFAAVNVYLSKPESGVS